MKRENMMPETFHKENLIFLWSSVSYINSCRFFRITVLLLDI